MKRLMIDVGGKLEGYDVVKGGWGVILVMKDDFGGGKVRLKLVEGEREYGYLGVFMLGKKGVEVVCIRVGFVGGGLEE